MVNVAAGTYCMMPGCGVYLHFTGLEPASGLVPGIIDCRTHLF